jgi:hypothetical protein
MAMRCPVGPASDTENPQAFITINISRQPRNPWDWLAEYPAPSEWVATWQDRGIPKQAGAGFEESFAGAGWSD